MRSDSILPRVLEVVLMAAFAAIAVGPVQAQSKADFNDDGYGDLATGASGENGSGAVHVLYGKADTGLHAYGNELLPAFGADAPARSHFGRFGAALAWGDFDNDGFTDLAVGIPGFLLLHDQLDRGAVRVYYGKKYGGLTDAYTQFFMGDDEGDMFGTALAVGNFNGDHYMDLAIGAPEGSPLGWESVGGGQILVLYGSVNGLSLTGADRRSQNSAGIPGGSEWSDSFGFALAAGNFGLGPEDDLAVGVPGENDGEGAVNIIYGSPTGLHYDNADLFQQGSRGLAGGRERGDWFGFSLAAGDFNLNGYMDLAMGSPGEDIVAENAGIVHVVYGGPNGLDSYFGQAFGQDWGAFDLRGVAAYHDLFGWSLAAGNFGQDSAADLAIGVPGDNIAGTRTGGAVNVVYGSFFTRLVVTGNQLWAQTDAGSGDLIGSTEDGDRFGFSLAALDVGRGSRADLIVGAPGESVSGQAGAGALNVIFSTSSGLSSLNNQLWLQDSSTSGIPVEDAAEANDHFGWSVGGADAGVLLPLY